MRRINIFVLLCVFILTMTATAFADNVAVISGDTTPYQSLRAAIAKAKSRKAITLSCWHSLLNENPRYILNVFAHDSGLICLHIID